jgi:hypothetical protein
MPGTLYVILRHEGIAAPHFDLMFQTEPASLLATWRLQSWPPPPSQAAEKLPDHRTAYLTFEGEISGGRGIVRRVEQGICATERTSDREWKVFLQSLPTGEKQSLLLRQESGGGWQCSVISPAPGE